MDHIERINDLRCFVKICFGKSAQTDQEIELDTLIQRDEDLREFVDLHRKAVVFYSKYRWPDSLEKRCGFVLTTSFVFEKNLPEVLRRNILQNPAATSLVLADILREDIKEPLQVFDIVYDRPKNMLWIRGMRDSKTFNFRMRAILYGLMVNNGSAYKRLLPLSVQSFERRKRIPTMGSLDDTLTEIRKILPPEYGIEGNGGWLTLNVPGDFLLIDRID